MTVRLRSDRHPSLGSGFALIDFGRPIDAARLEISVLNTITGLYLGPSTPGHPNWVKQRANFFPAVRAGGENSSVYRVGPEVTTYIQEGTYIEIATADDSVREEFSWEGILLRVNPAGTENWTSRPEAFELGPNRLDLANASGQSQPGPTPEEVEAEANRRRQEDEERRRKEREAAAAIQAKREADEQQRRRVEQAAAARGAGREEAALAKDVSSASPLAKLAAVLVLIILLGGGFAIVWTANPPQQRTTLSPHTTPPPQLEPTTRVAPTASEPSSARSPRLLYWTLLITGPPGGPFEPPDLQFTFKRDQVGEHWFIEADPTSLVRVVPPAGDLPNGNDSAATITIIPSEKARELPSGSSHVQPIRVTGPVGSIIISVQFNITENQTKIPPQSSDNEVTISGHGPFRGLRIANVSSGRGVVIMGLPHESNEGLRVGDVITVVNGRRIANIADLRQALREGDTWNVDAVRGDLTFSRVFGR